MLLRIAGLTFLCDCMQNAAELRIGDDFVTTGGLRPTGALRATGGLVRQVHFVRRLHDGRIFLPDGIHWETSPDGLWPGWL